MFTNEQVDVLASALPGCANPHRRELLPLVLEEWGRTDLEEHLERATPERVRTERQHMKKLARCATQLARTLSDLEPDCRFAIASGLLRGKSHDAMDWLNDEEPSCHRRR
jgi:hypothetical protein